MVRIKWNFRSIAEFVSHSVLFIKQTFLLRFPRVLAEILMRKEKKTSQSQDVRSPEHQIISRRGPKMFGAGGRGEVVA